MASILLWLRLSFIGLIASAAVGQLESEYSCPAGFTLFGESCYAYMQGRYDWQHAWVTCQSIQAHLVEIYTMEELEFVQNFSLDNGENQVWLGGQDHVQEGLWTWSWSGSPVELDGWKDGEPNNSGNEQCMEMDQGPYLWNDDECDSVQHFICQKSASATGAVVG